MKVNKMSIESYDSDKAEKTYLEIMEVINKNSLSNQEAVCETCRVFITCLLSAYKPLPLELKKRVLEKIMENMKKSVIDLVELKENQSS